MAHTAIVIGGGVGGLSAAIHLAAKRVRVTLLEKNPRVGGKLNLWIAPHPNRPADRPFTFDTGPSLLTIPLIFQDLFTAGGVDVRDCLQINRLDPIARYVWADGTQFELRSDDAARLAEVARFAPGDVAGFERLLRKGQSIWDLSAEAFLFHAPEQMLKRGRFSPWAALQMLTTPLRIGMFSNFAKAIDRHITSEKLRQVLYQYATYSGASPFRAPATLTVIPYAEMCFGAWYIPGGMYKLAQALEAVARKLGVEIVTDCTVEEILVQTGNAHGDVGDSLRGVGAPPTHLLRKRGRGAHATGVRTLSGETLHADVVIANSDVVYTYRHLISPQFRKKYADASLDKLEPGGSGLMLMLGVEGTYPQLAHHTKFMPQDYTSDLRAMFETHTIPDDPCIYVCASTRTDPTQAPANCENLFILASAPALQKTGTVQKTGSESISGIDWHRDGPRYRDQLIHTLETRFGLTDLSKRIVVERMMTPMDLKIDYNANAGSIYGIGSNSRRAAFLRPPNRDRDIAGLYFAGGATHPGGGLPLVALSGKIAAELAIEDLGVAV